MNSHLSLESIYNLFSRVNAFIIIITPIMSGISIAHVQDFVVIKKGGGAG